jgi:hypothetical protein
MDEKASSRRDRTRHLMARLSYADVISPANGLGYLRNMPRTLLRVCLSILLSLTMLATVPFGVSELAAGSDMEMTAGSPGVCKMCDKDVPPAGSAGCMQTFCSAPCILTEVPQIASAADRIHAFGEAVTPLEWRSKPPVSPA